MKQKRILVTGGAGFIGSALINFLIKNTSHHIINVDKFTYAAIPSALSEISQLKDRYTLYKVDICDKYKIEEIFTKEKPDVVMHLAAESHVDRSITDSSSFIETNIIGTYNLIEASRKYFECLQKDGKGDFLFHHISTDEVFGDLDDSNLFFSETTPYNPSSPYSASKASSDHLVRAWNRTYKLPVIITNCSNNYGPYQHCEKLIPLIIKNAIHGMSIPIYGSGQQIRDWLYVEDHVAALYDVICKGKVGETYNIGSHNERKNIDVVSLICDLLDKKYPCDVNEKTNKITSYKQLITYVEDRKGHDIRYAIDASKIKSELAWSPKESFESGLDKTVNWYLKYYLEMKK